MHPTIHHQDIFMMAEEPCEKVLSLITESKLDFRAAYVGKGA